MLATEERWENVPHPWVKLSVAGVSCTYHQEGCINERCRLTKQGLPAKAASCALACKALASCYMGDGGGSQLVQVQHTINRQGWNAAAPSSTGSMKLQGRHTCMHATPGDLFAIVTVVARHKRWYAQ
jgi:hypothetical protein